MTDKVLISRKDLRGEDGYKTFSVRIKDETVDCLNQLAADANRSRNEVVGILLEYAINHCEIIEENIVKKKKK